MLDVQKKTPQKLSNRNKCNEYILTNNVKLMAEKKTQNNREQMRNFTDVKGVEKF